jgi:multidrug efflux pump subunit AcrA (membrane-fusion protein)
MGQSAAEAAVEAASQRLRPILMTSLAMVAGMAPMALALGEGGEQTAPLARAVIGGLSAATLATLILLPFVFMIVQGPASRRAPSLDPDDPESIYHTASKTMPTEPLSAASLLQRAAGWVGGFVLCVAAGCHRPTDVTTHAPSQAEAPAQAVKTTKPVRQTIRRTIEQPGELMPFEQTPIFSKISGYVKQVHVDIGDPVRANDVLATLWAPEMEVEVKRKGALVRKAEAEHQQARQLLASAEAVLNTAEAKVREAEAGRLRARAELDRAKSQFERLKRSTAVVTQDVLDEARLGFEAAQATAAEVEAKIKSAEASRIASAAQRDKAQVDISVAEASVQVAKSERDLAQTMLDYAKIRSPFGGTVTRRHVDTGHYLPAAGGKSEPLFVVVRTEPLRVVVDLPEADATFIAPDTRASVIVQALKGRTLAGAVKRTAWALDARSRTLRAEIELPNPDGDLRPGMYVHSVLTVERANVWAVPESAIARDAGKPFLWQVSDGKAMRRMVRLGMSDGKMVEVLMLHTPSSSSEWQNASGSEEFILPTAGLKEGQAVTLPLDQELKGHTPRGGDLTPAVR